MNHDKFLEEVLRLMQGGTDRNMKLNAALGMVCEAGEAGDIVKKEVFHDIPVDLGKLRKEIGDTLFYMYALAHYYGITIPECQALLVKKLRARYPNGFVRGGGIREGSGA